MIFLALNFRMKYKRRNISFFGLVTGLIAGFVFILPYITSAQTLEIGISGGASYYIGDLNPALPYNEDLNNPKASRYGGLSLPKQQQVHGHFAERNSDVNGGNNDPGIRPV